MRQNHPYLFFLIFFLHWQALLPQTGIHPPTDTLTSSGKPPLFSLEPALQFDKKRFWVGAGTGFALWAGASVAMWEAWYKDFPLTHFHTFNDTKEWQGMDKFGHAHATYTHAYYIFKGARWTGMSRKKAVWTGVGAAIGIQSTIEVMDGFSEEWGFSIADMAFNIVGAGLFAAQEMAWQEQRISMKVSSTRPAYPNTPIFSVEGGKMTDLQGRANDLYGSTPTETFLKDYNAMTIWASFNIHSLFPKKEYGRIPKWLNMAFGIGAGNIYGGFRNEWTGEEGHVFVLDEKTYPRYTQFYMAPDIDFSRIPTRKRWLKMTLTALNWLKMPSPALEIRSTGGIHFRPIYW